MKILYLDCSMGAAGDMIMGALISLLSHDEQQRFIEELNGVGIPGVKVMLSDDKKCGIEGKHVKVLVRGVEEGSIHIHNHESHHHGEYHHEKHHHEEHHHGEHQHGEHHHEGHHHSSMKDIENIVEGLNISPHSKNRIMSIYSRIAQAESQVHGTVVTEIHFHEVGMMDAIADITGTVLLMEKLSPEKVVVSPVNVGYGTVLCAHGTLPVPAPATACLLKGIPSYAGNVEGELCTPTGAAIIGFFANEFSVMPLMSIEGIGYGTGSKDFDTANVVRAVLGNTYDLNSNKEELLEKVVELKCNMDDITAEEMGYAQEVLMENGAREVFFTAVTMKKSRPGVMLTVICSEENKEKMAELIFKHTTTIGIRVANMDRLVLGRKEETVHTDLGDVRIKISEGYGVRKFKAEYEDMKGIALKKEIPIGEVRQEVIKAMDSSDFHIPLMRDGSLSHAARYESPSDFHIPLMRDDMLSHVTRYEKLCSIIRDMKRVAVAFSGGVDSTLLLKAAYDTLGENAIAITVNADSFPQREFEETVSFCKKEGIQQRICNIDVLQIPEFAVNSPNRCYICKKYMFNIIKEEASKNGAEFVLEGSNADDMEDYRPGMKAVSELNIKSPLLMAGLTKDEIRRLSEMKGLAVYNKPAYACLATRIPYGEDITKEKLNMAEQAEFVLLSMGFSQMRVRIHEGLHEKFARIEVPPEEFPEIIKPEAKNKVVNKFAKIGFKEILLDLRGYRMGSMNEALKQD